MHNKNKCKKCYQKQNGICLAFTTMKDPILNEKDECIAAIYDKKEYKKLVDSLHTAQIDLRLKKQAK